MTVIEWDKVGERFYQTGVDRGVLYLKDGRVVPWNGLTSVEDGNESKLNTYYLDGRKFLETVTPGDFTGKLTAFTYPDEFEEVLGIAKLAPGLHFHEQQPKSFNLAYRTLVSSDSNPDHGYKIHLLYNLQAIADSHTYETTSNDQAIPTFAWALTGVPPGEPVTGASGLRPTVHVTIDSTDTRPDILEALEEILYGTPSTSPRFPTILELRVIFGEIGGLFIIDNGDGTWTAIDSSDDYISMVDSETFQIDHADATYLDPDTYTVSDTPIPLP